MNAPKVTRRARRQAAAPPRATVTAVTAVAVIAILSALAGCTAPLVLPGAAYASGTRAAPPQPTARTRVPSAPVSVLTETSSPIELTARFARTVFATSPVVVVASAGGSKTGKTGGSVAGKTIAEAASAASTAHAPLLLVPQPLTSQGIVQLAAAVKALRPMAVLVEGLPTGALAARLPGVLVVSQPAELPATGAPARLAGLAVLLLDPAAKHSPARPARAAGDATAAEIIAITATARAAGATVIDATTRDPRIDQAAIRTLARHSPRHVVAIGSAFGPASRLSARLAVAETGRQLPGGGQVLFPGRRLVALYGHPDTPGLGVLGQQDLPESIARVRLIAAEYQPLSTVPVVPAFEIIATVAEASPGPDGTYSYQTPVSQLQPWIKQATAAGMYVVLDLQPGRASLLTQARAYQSVLEQPDVGLGLDPEWKLLPGQKPLTQIGHVDVSEVNDVISWLAALTARHHLPQKLLVIHQFQLAMIVGEQDLDTSNDDLAIVIHMDGQGTPGAKEATWNAVTRVAPRGVSFGWKDFLVMDHPTFTPQQTMAQSPLPVMISYQ